MGTGAELSFPRMSEQRPGQIPGNVVMTLKQKAHPRFKRSGDDLHADMVLTLKEALLGFSRGVEHLVVGAPEQASRGIAGDGRELLGFMERGYLEGILYNHEITTQDENGLTVTTTARDSEAAPRRKRRRRTPRRTSISTRSGQSPTSGATLRFG